MDSWYTLMNRDFSQKYKMRSQSICTNVIPVQPWSMRNLATVHSRVIREHLPCRPGSCRYSPVLPRFATVMSQLLLVWHDCTTIICQWSPGGASVVYQCYKTRINEDKTWTNISSLLFLRWHICHRNVWHNCSWQCIILGALVRVIEEIMLHM